MQARDDERLSATTGVVGTLAVGLFALVAGATGDAAPPGAAWWTAYLLYLLVFAVASGIVVPQPRWLPDPAVVAALLVLGLTTWFLDPDLGWTAVLLVVTAAAAAYALTRAAVVAVIAVQTVGIAAGSAVAGVEASANVLITMIYACFMAFAALTVLATRREAAARADLAAAHADLRAATALLGASSREAERLRISRDLHDVVGHRLTALALELEVAAHRATGPAAEHVTRARTIAKDLLADVRVTVGGLREAPGGLETILRELVTDLPGLAVDLEVDEQVPVGERQAVAVVRCVQEIVTNTLRHAKAGYLEIAVVADETGVAVTARDDGRGTAQLRPGHGLVGMTERIEQLGGQLTLDPGPGRGFGVTARIPAT
ncbi:sensor histidine kinase [Georgenia yuyongxinii]|uniref:Sensor histidine kinase n=1 Tax=Georgenia yuyongxinii TaxID=2589797 RepID=A0A5B8CAG2_9MICO|nr:sensor histidine kinase [Georgenia yuyongxinii]QDC26232.1 sensor histidine kinase [Georgenia yuyongxinii]